MSYTREALYELIWSKSLNAAAAALGISMPTLRQLCLDHSIPLPWSGYRRGDKQVDLPAVDEPFEIGSAIATARHSLRFPGESAATFLIPRKLADPDPLIIGARDTVRQDYQLHGMAHMLRSGSGVTIRASKNNFDRALRIMDTLIKIWRSRGYRIVSGRKETTVYLREVNLHVGMRETTTIEPSLQNYGSQIHTATGQLAFKMKGWMEREWKDGKVPLESHIQEITDYMEVAARDLEQIWAKRKIIEQKEKEERQAQAIRIQQDAEEKAAFETLLAEAQRWHQLRMLDQYLDALQQKTPASPAFQQWLQWARHRRKLFDPIENNLKG